MQFSSLSLTVILVFFSFLSLSIVYVKISEAVQAGSLVQRHRWRVVRGMSEKRGAGSEERGAKERGAQHLLQPVSGGASPDPIICREMDVIQMSEPFP